VISKEAETTTQAVDDKVKKERVDVQGDDSRIKRKAS
jgi:stress response protein YsnF